MPAPLPITLEADPTRNTLRVAYRGNVTPAAMAAARAKLETALSAFQPGFTVLTDLTDLDAMELDCVSQLTAFMDRFRAAGVATVIRVIPDREKDIGFNILSIIHYRRGVRIVTCETRAEADKLLKPSAKK